MEEIKQKLLTFMESAYKVTKWATFRYVDLEKAFGKETMPALLELKEENKVAFRISVHGRFIEYIPEKV